MFSYGQSSRWKGKLWDRVGSDLLKLNCILHETFVREGAIKKDIEERHYKVTPFGKFTKKEETVWVNGSVFSKMIPCTKVTKKYVMDDTVIPKKGWVTLDYLYDQ